VPKRRMPFLIPWELMDVVDRNLWIADHVMGDWYEMVPAPGIRLGGLRGSMNLRVGSPDAGSGQYEVQLFQRGYAEDASAAEMFEAKFRSEGVWPEYIDACVAVRVGQPGMLRASPEETDELIATFTPAERAHAAYLVTRMRAMNADQSSSGRSRKPADQTGDAMDCGEIIRRYEAVRDMPVSGEKQSETLATELDELANLAEGNARVGCRFVAERARELASHLRTGFPPK